MIVTCLLKHWEIAKEIFIVFQIMKKTTFLSRNISSLTNLLIRKERGKSKSELRFIDNLRFMASSLDNLSSNLKIDQFVNLKKYYSGNQLSLLLRKGVYLYDYVDCMKKLDETSFIEKDAFYSKLTGESITDEDYQHAQSVWSEFNIETMKDYHNLFNLSDVLLLADIFENFWNLCMIHYRLDPA